MKRVVGLFLGMAVTACSGGGDKPAIPATIDPADYLAQSVCPPPSLCEAQQAGDKMRYRRGDWPAPSYQLSDSVYDPRGHYVTTWSYAPHGPFVAANGDGGEVITLKDGVARIVATQDGSKPGIQRFTAWWLFDDRTPQGAWRWGDAWGRARRETVTYPAAGYGLTEITADTIISEHYDLPNQGGKLERFYFVKDLGRAAWQVYAPSGTPPADLAQRCPALSWDGPPAERPDWVLIDCRITTRFVEWDNQFTTLDYGWPPKEFTP